MKTRPEINQSERELILLEIIKKLSEEIHGGRIHALDEKSDLIRDAGIDSLARIELLLRIDRTFGITLSEEDAMNASNVTDLIRAMEKVQSVKPRKESGQNIIPIVQEKRELKRPENAKTLAEVLEWYNENFPDNEYIRFLPSGEGAEESLTYSRLYRGAERIASGLRDAGYAPGKCAAIMLPTGFDYLYSFFGIILAGNIPVPIYPPQSKKHIEEHLKRQITILKNSEAAVLITVPEAMELKFLLKSSLVNLKDVVTPENLMSESSKIIVLPDAEDIAFIQYTSGTTGNPKGVILSHSNLLSNIRSMGRAINVTDEDLFVSWLPLYHDMGLIGAVFATLYHGVPLVLMSPLSFIAKPRRWMEAIHKYRGTISAAPNFAYELCLNAIQEDTINSLDLGSWRLALNGAEPISPATLEKFAEKFSKCGFKRSSLFPVYGLAENSVGLSFPPPGRGPVIDHVDREAFSEKRLAVPVRDMEGSKDLLFVGCGSALPDNRIRIVREDGREAAEREVGRIQFISPSSTKGYYRNPDATESLYRGKWLDSGDNGYIANGELFITGREKEIIIRAGRNIYPYELEDAIGEIPGVRPGGVAVFALRNSDGTERMIVVAESRNQKEKERAKIIESITELCVKLHQFAPDDIVIAPLRTVLRTSSGKIRRGDIKKLYESGNIGKTSSVRMQMFRLGLSSIPGRISRILSMSAHLLYGSGFWIAAAFFSLPALLSILLIPGIKSRFSALRFLLRCFFFTVRIKRNISGKEHIRNASDVIFVSNHTSYLDGAFIISLIPFPVRFIAKSEFRNKFFAGLILKRLGVIFVERFDPRTGLADVRSISEHASESYPLYFFAEGTFTKNAGLRPFRMGAFATAVNNRHGIVPISINGARSILPDENYLPFHGNVRITVFEIIQEEGAGWDAAINMRNRVREKILEHCGEADLRTLM